MIYPLALPPLELPHKDSTVSPIFPNTDAKPTRSTGGDTDPLPSSPNIRELEVPTTNPFNISLQAKNPIRTGGTSSIESSSTMPVLTAARLPVASVQEKNGNAHWQPSAKPYSETLAAGALATGQGQPAPSSGPKQPSQANKRRADDATLSDDQPSKKPKPMAVSFTALEPGDGEMLNIEHMTLNPCVVMDLLVRCSRRLIHMNLKDVTIHPDNWAGTGCPAAWK